MKLTVWILLVLCPAVHSVPCVLPENLAIGTFRPRCTADAKWEPRQCHGSTGLCWCVLPDGQRVTPGLPAGELDDCAMIIGSPEAAHGDASSHEERQSAVTQQPAVTQQHTKNGWATVTHGPSN
jgi:hypothetical protein